MELCCLLMEGVLFNRQATLYIILLRLLIGNLIRLSVTYIVQNGMHILYVWLVVVSFIFIQMLGKNEKMSYLQIYGE